MRWPTWSGDAFRRLAWPAAALWAVAAERQAYDVADVRHWLPDLLTGLVLVGGGLYAAQRLGTRCGSLLALCGVLWFLPNFATVDGPWGALAGQATYVHRGPLVHALLAFPTGRLTARSARLATTAGYLVAVVPWFWASTWGTVSAVAALGAAATVSVLEAPGRYRHARLVAAQAAGAVGLVLLGALVARHLEPGGAAVEPSLLTYELVLAGAVAVLVVELRARTWERAALTDLVLDEGGHHTSLRDALAWCTGSRCRGGTQWRPSA